MLITVLLAALVFSTGCSDAKPVILDGRFVYTSGGGDVHTMILGSSEASTFSSYNSEELVAIDRFTKVTSSTLLFGECAVTGECTIRELDVTTRQAKLLRSGRLPSYIASHGKFFFYDTASDDNSWLFLADLDDAQASMQIAREPKWRVLPNGISQSRARAVVQISDDEVVFVGEDGYLWRYSIATGELTPMKIENCRPLLWRERTGTMLCADWDSWSPFFLDLHNGEKVEAPELEGAYGIAYIPSSDSLVYGRTRSSFIIGEAYDIFLYSFLDKNEKRIQEDSHLAEGVWMGNVDFPPSSGHSGGYD